MKRATTLSRLISTTALAATILGAFLVGHSHGATITAVPQTNHANTYNVHIDGVINLNDDGVFDKVTKGLNGAKVVVVLNSPGGNVLAGLGIGALIHDNKFSTQVPEKVTCTSMCSNIWLAGATRYAALDSKIGFHSAGINVGKNGNQRTVRINEGNAVLTKYYLALGLSKQTATVLLAADPSDITWLNVGLAEGLGIEWTVYAPNRDAWKKTMEVIANTPTGINEMFWPSSVPPVPSVPSVSADLDY
jgi:hypothetical protein